MQYRPEIDGLRALAVLPVMLFHAGFDAFSGGFVGVDVFFVLSGYLITSIILAETRAGTFSLLGFYERRMRRILPPLFVVLLTCVPLAWWLMLPADLKAFAASLAHVALFASNLLFRRESDYFDAAAELKPLLHTWSLAVEEQFYLIFPLLLLALGWLGAKWRLPALMAGALASFAYSQWASVGKPEAAFFLLQSRAWELLVGVLCAFWLEARSGTQAEASRLRSIAAEGLAIAGLLAIGTAILTFDKATPFPGFAALLPTLGTASIILLADERTLVGRALRNRLLVGMGLISYGAYLWHQPLLAFARYRSAGTPSDSTFLALILLAIGLAFLSWKLVETPVRDRARTSRRFVFASSIAGSLVLLGLGAIGDRADGFEDYFYAERLSPAEREIYSIVKEHTSYRLPPAEVDDGKCKFRSQVIDQQFSNRFRGCAASHGRAVVVLGDSHAQNIYNALYRAGFGEFVIGLAKGACRPHEPGPDCPYEPFLRFAEENSGAIAYVIYHQSGSHFLSDHRGRIESPDLFAPGTVPRVHTDSIGKVSAYLESLERHVEVVWLGPFVEAWVDFKNLRFIFNNGFVIRDEVLRVFAQLDNAIKAYLGTHTQSFAYLSLVDILGIDRNFLMRDGCLTYRDVDHFSRCGEAIVGARLAPHLDAEKLLPTPQ